MGARSVNLTSYTDFYSVVYVKKGGGRKRKWPQKAHEQCKCVEGSGVRHRGLKWTLAQGRRRALSGAAALARHCQAGMQARVARALHVSRDTENAVSYELSQFS